MAYITNIAADRLREKGNRVLVISADRYLRATPGAATFDGLKAKVFLAVHAEGSVKPCSAKASLGYPNKSSLMTAHTVGWSLASALGYSYSDFSRDGYTGNEADYYMFRQVQADRLMAILEVGELTCPDRERQLISSAQLIGANLAYAIDFIVKTPTAKV